MIPSRPKLGSAGDLQVFVAQAVCVLVDQAARHRS